MAATSLLLIASGLNLLSIACHSTRRKVNLRPRYHGIMGFVVQPMDEQARYQPYWTWQDHPLARAGGVLIGVGLINLIILLAAGHGPP